MRINKTKGVYLAALLLLSTFSFAQFSRVGNGFSNIVRTLYSDSLTHGLIAGGNYVWEMQDSTVVSGIARWNGVKWDSIATRIVPNHGNVVAGIEKFYRYQGDLYANGLFSEPISAIEIDPTYPSVIARLDTIANIWQPMSCILSGAGIIHSGFIMGDTMYVTGVQDTLCGNAPSMIYKYDGANFFPDYTLSAAFPYFASNSVNILFEYQGILYMTGGIYDPGDSSFKLFMQWNGTDWIDVPGIGGEMTIRKMLIFNNELYVSGYFFKGQGTPGNCIAKFDGTTWSDLGGGVCTTLSSPDCCSANITDFTFYNNELYVVGSFNYAGGVPAQNIAKWDGANWCGLGSTFDNTINTIGEWNDSLYIGGGFKYIDGDTVNYVAKWLGGINTCSTNGIFDTQDQEELLNLYPNPATNQLTLEFELVNQESSQIEIRNILGQVIWSNKEQFSQGKQKLEIDVSSLPPGIYFVQLMNGGNMSSAKFVKQ